MTLWNSEQLQRTCCFSRRANGGKGKGPSCGKCREGAQPFVCGFRGAFYITPPEGNLICSHLFVYAAKTGLFTPRPGHVFIYISKAQNILNHTRPWMGNFQREIGCPFAGPRQHRVAWTSPLKSDLAATKQEHKFAQEVQLPRNCSESTIINSQPRLINPDMYVQSAKNQLASPNWCKPGKRNLYTVRHSLLTSPCPWWDQSLATKKCTSLNFFGKFIHIFKNAQTHL